MKRLKHQTFTATPLLLVACLYLFTTLRSASAQDTLTLPVFLRQAVSGFSLAKDRSLTDEINRFREKNLKSSFYPRLDLNAQAAYYSDVVTIDVPVTIPGLEFPQPYHDQYSVALELKQTIYDGGVTRQKYAIDRVQTEIRHQEVEVQVHQFRQKLTSLFFAAILLDDNEAILRENLAYLDTALYEMKAAVDQGMILQGEYSVLKASRVELEQQLVANRYDRKAITGIMAHYLDTTISDSVVLRVPEPKIPNTGLKRPEITLYRMQSQLLGENISLQKDLRKPHISGFGQLGYGRPGLNPLNEDFNTYYLLGATIRWNIWDWKQGNRNSRMLSLRQDQVGIQQEAFRDQVEEELIKIRQEISKLEELIRLDHRKAELRKEGMNAALHKLRGGTITPSEYEKYLISYRQALLELNLHKKQKQQKKVEYMITQGTVTEYENNNNE